MSEPSAAVVTVKELQDRDNAERIVTLSNGVKVKLVPVSATLIDEVVSHVKDPEIPNWHNPDKDRDEPNPNDPAYLRALSESERARGVAAMDAMVMFGLELTEEMPPIEEFLGKLKMLAKLGHLDLKVYDMEDPVDREFLYKRFVLATPEVLNMLTDVTGMTTREVAQAERSFPSN